MKDNYIRVGTEYYKEVGEPNINGSINTYFTKWAKIAIVDDFGKKYLKKINKYDGFVNIPSHENYEQTIGNFYNKYEKIKHQPKAGKIEVTKSFLKPIFKDQIELFYDFLAVIWFKPEHILPILCLVSEERSTGKTTFLNWLKDIFGHNMTINKSRDFESDFNSDWADKLIISVEEAKFTNPNTYDLLKDLSTAKYNKVHAKGKNKKEGSFFGKIVLTSNHVNDFIKIDKNEIRFWVVELEKINKSINDLENKLFEEIPHFLNFIRERGIKSPRKTRMWFTKEQIETSALKNVVISSTVDTENEIKLIIEELFEKYNVDEIKLTLSDLQEILKKNNMRKTMTEIKNIIEVKWKLRKTTNSTSYVKYHQFYDDYSKKFQVEHIKTKGRVFTFQKELFQLLKK